MSRDREHDKWIPWYVEDTPGWLELSLAARGAMEGIARKLNDKTGELHLRRGLSSLAVLLHVTWADLEPALGELVAKGKVTWDGSRFVLSDPEYAERRRRNSANRMADKRARDREVTGVTSRASLPSLVDPVTGVTAVLVSSDLISSESDLRSDARGAAEAAIDAEGPPLWWGPTLATIEMTTGEALPSGEAWLRYAGHRASKEPPKPVSKPDAQYWLTSVMVPERRKARDDARHRDKRDASFDAKRKFSKDGPERVEPTPQQAKQFADQLAQRLLGNRKVGT